MKNGKHVAPLGDPLPDELENPVIKSRFLLGWFHSQSDSISCDLILEYLNFSSPIEESAEFVESLGFAKHCHPFGGFNFSGTVSVNPEMFGKVFFRSRRRNLL